MAVERGAATLCGSGGGAMTALDGSGGGTTGVDALGRGVDGGAPPDDPADDVPVAAADFDAVSHNPHATPATASSVLAFSSDERPPVR